MRRIILSILLLAAMACAAPAWQQWRGSRCEWCGTAGRPGNPITWHHVRPQAMFPAERNNPTNGLTLCLRCQFVLGHYNDTENKYNPNIIELVRHYNWHTAAYAPTNTP